MVVAGLSRIKGTVEDAMKRFDQPSRMHAPEPQRMNDKSASREVRPCHGMAWLAIRHGVASLATIVAACAVWTLTYVALLLWAFASDGGLGGPLAYPGGLLVVSVTAAVACLLLFFPATALAEWICRRRALPILVQIPVSVAMLATLCILAGITVQVFRNPIPFGESVTRFSAGLFGLSLLPVGFYWWIAQAGPLLRAVTRNRGSD